MKALLLLALVAAASCVQLFDAGYENGNVDSWVMRELRDYGSANVFVKLWGDKDLSESYTIQNKLAKRQWVYNALREHAEKSQAPLIAFLQSRNLKFQSFWIANTVEVFNADRELVQLLAARSDVEVIRGDREVQLHQPVSIEPAERPQALEWNILKVKADQAWALGYKGQNAVLSNIDTGVRYTHEALNYAYRGTTTGSHDYNWFDPRGTYKAPGDNNGHGTHTMGTIAGRDTIGIGVAPEAKWVAAKGCYSSSCTTADLIASAQWVLAPTPIAGGSGDPSKAPDVVSNSWGGGSGDTWYKSYTDAWRAAGMQPVFSQGNSGPSCSSANSPGDNAGVLGVAATDSNDALASFSSRGPGRLVTQKPEISAPGYNVRSSYSTSDTAYASLSGTSMACPHITGVVGLMLSANPALTPDTIEQILKTTVDTATITTPPSPTSCGGVMWNVFPNYHFGYGRVNALAAVQKAKGL